MQIDVKASRPAKARKAIVFCCDNGYLPFAALAASRILRYSKRSDFDLCVAYNERPVDVPQSLASLDLRLLQIDVNGGFCGLRLDKGKSHDVYLRLALPDALVDDYDRILYLDADVFIESGDFSALLDVDLGGRPLGAVRDNIQWRTPSRMPRQYSVLGIDHAPYFNAGVLLMDVAAYREMGLLSRCIELGTREAPRMIRHDQNLYNAVLKGNWAELSPVWNWQYTPASRLHEAMVSARLVHFIGPSKPWKTGPHRFPPRFIRELIHFCAAHFPDRSFDIPDGPGPGSKLMTKMLVRHLINRNKMARYLARFPDDYTVIT